MKLKKKERSLDLKDILDLGGKQEDLELLKDLDDEKDEIVVEDCEDNETTTEAVHKYIKRLNLKGDVTTSKQIKRIKDHGKKEEQDIYQMSQEEVLDESSARHSSKKVQHKNNKERLIKKKNKVGNNAISGTVLSANKSRENIVKNRKVKNKYKLQDEEITSTVVEPRVDPLTLWSNHKQRTTLLIKPGTKWFEHNLARNPNDHTPASVDLVEDWKKFAENLLKEDINLYKKYQKTREDHSDFNWVRTVISSGTLSDKVAAHTLLIQDSPVHNLLSLDALIKMINLKGKRECLMSMDALRDLFLSDLLLSDKKLKSFEQNPFSKLEEISSGNHEARDKRLLLWYFEHNIKLHYASFVQALESVSHDTVEKMKQKAVTVISELLTYNPEQEQFLLVKLVNKLGDPAHKVAAHVAHLLGKVVDHHPNMKEIVVKEVEHLLFRSNIKERTQYYALCFLNQLILNQTDSNLASRLIHIYFSFFKSCVNKGEVDTKMMSALLTGVSRAYPYSKLKDHDLTERLNTMYRIVHMVSFNVSAQALMLIFQVLDSKDDISDRFYTSLYRKILDPALSHSSKQAMFLNLVYQALKRDVSLTRVKAFVKRLLQICHYQLPPLVCGILYLISEVIKKHPSLTEVKQQHLLDSDDEEHYQDAIEDDDSPHEGCDLESRKTLTGGELKSDEKEQSQPQYSWLHHANLNKKTASIHEYDPHCRNPLFAGAEFSTLWELSTLKKHFHPTVSLFAHKLFSNEPIKYSGDPLQDFTLSRFLDRFAYRNPKKTPASESTAGYRRVFGRRNMYCPSGTQQISVTSDSYVQQNESNIPVEEIFLHRYFSQKAVTGHRKDDSDVESVCSDEFDQYLKKKLNIGSEKDEHLDFAADVSSTLQNKRKKLKDNELEGDKTDDDDDLSIDDEEDINFEEDEDFQKAFADYNSDLEDTKTKHVAFDEEDAAFSENDDFEGVSKLQKRKKCSQKQKPAMKKKKGFDAGLFASAEEFSALLDENVGNKIDGISAQALSNWDNADAKQLTWEMKRDQWLRGRGHKSKKKQQKYRKPSNNRSLSGQLSFQKFKHKKRKKPA